MRGKWVELTLDMKKAAVKLTLNAANYLFSILWGFDVA